MIRCIVDPPEAIWIAPSCAVPATDAKVLALLWVEDMGWIKLLLTWRHEDQCWFNHDGAVCDAPTLWTAFPAAPARPQGGSISSVV